MIKTTLVSIPEENLENIEIECLQAYLERKKYDVESIYLDPLKKIEEQFLCLDKKSRIFNLSVYSESSVYPKELLKFADLAKMIKNECESSVVLLSGKYASVYYKDILKDKRFEAIDYIMLGDCEYTLEKLIKIMSAKKNVNNFIKTNNNIASRDSLDNKEFLNIDINALPFSKRTFLKKEENKNKNYYAFIYESRGCSMQCSFCTRGQFYKHWTGRSAKDIFEEIRNIVTFSKVRCFWFYGGSFEDPGGERGKKKIKDFCTLVIESGLNISMRCYLRSNFVAKVDQQLLDLMKKAGFQVVLVGIEAGNDFDLKLYNKGTTVENNILTLEKLRKAKIYSEHFGFIMINPYSTLERLRENFLFLQERQPHDLDNYVHHLILDPGTNIRRKVENDGLMVPAEDFVKQGISYRFVNSDVEEISQFLKRNFLIFDTETAGTSTFVYHFAPFLPNQPLYEEKILTIMQKRAKIFSEYFKILYINMDIGGCEKDHKEFISTIEEFEIQLRLLKGKMIRELVKYQIL